LIRTAGITALLAVATCVLWWAVFPAGWSVVPTRDPNTLASPVRTGHWVAEGAGLAVLAGVAGYVRGALVALAGVAVPAFVLFCVYSASAQVVGANLWAVGALFLAPPLVAGVAAAAALGALVRRRQIRPPTTTV
jgi:hypothetical protein